MKEAREDILGGGGGPGKGAEVGSVAGWNTKGELKRRIFTFRGLPPQQLCLPTCW